MLFRSDPSTVAGYDAVTGTWSDTDNAAGEADSAEQDYAETEQL